MSILREHGYGVTMIYDHRNKGRGPRFIVGSRPFRLRLPAWLEDVLVDWVNPLLCRVYGHWWEPEIDTDFSTLPTTGRPRARFSGMLNCFACPAQKPDPKGVGEWVEADKGRKLDDGMDFGFPGLKR